MSHELSTHIGRSGPRPNSRPVGGGDSCSIEADIAIVGGGLVGVPLALALSAAGWSVVLIDAGADPDTGLGIATAAEQASWKFDPEKLSAVDPLKQRCTAINVGTRQWLSRQNIWEAVATDACPIKRVSITHKGYFGATRLVAEEHQLPAFGYVINNVQFIQQLRQLCDARQVRCVYKTRVTRVTHNEPLVCVHTDNNVNVNAKLLVAADGVSSIIRESAGIETTQVNYDQAAVLGMVQISESHSGIAYERFTSSGPLAMLPRPGPYMNFVDCIDPREQAEIEQYSDENYLNRLQRRFGYRLGRLQAVGPRFVSPLLRIEAASQTGNRTVLLGNAARLLHPVAGQGYNLAIRDVAALVTLLDSNELTDPGATSVLSEFTSQRSADQKSLVRLTDVLARGFRGNASMPGHLRAGALLGLDLISPLKKRFVSKTTGIPGL